VVSVVALALAASAEPLNAPGAPFTLAVDRIVLEGLFEVREAELVDRVAVQLARPGVALVTPKAPGVQGVLVGRVRRAETGGVQVLLRVLAVEDGQALATFYETGIDESRVGAATEAGARLLAEDLRARGAEALALGPTVHASATSPVLRKVAWASLAMAGLAALVATVCLLDREARYADDRRTPGWQAYSQEALQAGERLAAISVGTAVTAGVALATFGVLWFLGTRPIEVAPVLTLSPGGASLGLAGAW
jgi:hypothetical protein